MDFSNGIWTLLHVNFSTDGMHNATTMYRTLYLSTVFLPVKFVLCFVSLLVSLVNVRVLTRQSTMKNSMNVLLVSLHSSTFLLSLFEKVTLVLRYVLGSFVSLTVIVDSVSDSLSSMCAYFINWITSVISFWRFVEIRFPERSEHLLTRRKAVIVIIVLVILTISPDSVLNSLGSMKLKIMGKFSKLKALTNTTALEKYIEGKLNIKGKFTSLKTLTNTTAFEEFIQGKVNIKGQFSNLKELTNSTSLEGYIDGKLNIKSIVSNLLLANATAFEQYIQESDMSPTYSLAIKWVGYLVKTFQYVFPLGSFIGTSFYSLKKACTTKVKEDLLLKCKSNIHLDAAQMRKTFVLLFMLGSYMISTTLEPLIELFTSTETILHLKSVVDGFVFTHVTNIMSFFAHHHMDPEFRNAFWKHFKRGNRSEEHHEFMETGSFEIEDSH